MIEYIVYYLFSSIIGFGLTLLLSTFFSKIFCIEIIGLITSTFFPGLILGYFIEKKAVMHGIFLAFFLLLIMVGILCFAGYHKHPEFTGNYFKIIEKIWLDIFILFILCPIFTFISSKIFKRTRK